MKAYALRLHPGDDLKGCIDDYIALNRIEAACIITCVGSLQKATLRFANKPDTSTIHGYFEIVSLTGVLSINGSHYHISIADGEGRTYGGHLMEGSEVYTTAEIIIAQFEELVFQRALDGETGYPELEIADKSIIFTGVQ